MKTHDKRRKVSGLPFAYNKCCQFTWDTDNIVIFKPKCLTVIQTVNVFFFVDLQTFNWIARLKSFCFIKPVWHVWWNGFEITCYKSLSERKGRRTIAKFDNVKISKLLKRSFFIGELNCVFTRSATIEFHRTVAIREET